LEFDYKTFYNDFGILHQTYCIETPHQNTMVKMKHQHILKVVKSIMFHSNLPKQVWSYVISHIVYIINRLPFSTIKFKITDELLYKHVPDLSILRVFGCLGFPFTITNNVLAY